MKVCIIGIQNIKHMTLISIYTNFFKQHDIEYDLIYIDKYGIEEETEAKCVYKFDASKPVYNSVIGKALKGILFKKYATNLIKKNNYDFIVVWREQTAAMFADFLSRNYNKRYSVNIRDLWDRKNIYIEEGVKKAVSKSAFNTVSSGGFLKNVPNADYVLVHSINQGILRGACGERKIKSNGEPLVITYIGTVRFYNYCFSLIDAFKNDNRFLLKFIGQGSDKIQDYVKAQSINNVVCIGAFQPEETIDLLEDADIINSAFGAKSEPEKALMPIRYYYSVYKKCPVLTTKGTWVDNEASRIGIGISVPESFHENNDDIREIVLQSYRKIVSSDIDAVLDKYREELIEENNKFITVLSSALENPKI